MEKETRKNRSRPSVEQEGKRALGSLLAVPPAVVVVVARAWPRRLGRVRLPARRGPADRCCGRRADVVALGRVGGRRHDIGRPADWSRPEAVVEERRRGQAAAGWRGGRGVEQWREGEGGG